MSLFYELQLLTYSLYTINLYMLAKSEFLVNLWKDILNKPNTAKDNATRKSFLSIDNIDENKFLMVRKQKLVHSTKIE